MSPLIRNMLISSIALAIFAIVGTTLVATTYDMTAERIKANHRATLLNGLHVLVPPDQHDNDLFSDVIEVMNKDLLGSNKPVRIYRARKEDKPVAAIINSIAPDGYSGRIELLVAIRANGTIQGVRIVKHKETPGLGDAIDHRHSNWADAFITRSLSNPDKKGWAVKRDGGIFDQFTGATISPRAVVNATYKTLLYFDKHHKEIFSKPSMAIEE